MQLIVTGSSAGGIDSLSRLVATLPSSFPAPIVVAQHLDPRMPSNLAAILAKRTALRVVSVADHEHLEPGTVYVVPADRHVEISDSSVSVSQDGGPTRSKPSIDLLFATAAERYGSRLIAVVLTGMGSDGSAGARAVKHHGGTVVIEDPQTATFPSMPASLAPALVDIVAPVDLIGPELVRLVGESVDLENDIAALRELMDRVRSRNGIDFSHYKMPTIRRRLMRQMAVAGATSLPEYLERLDADPAEYQRLVSTFLVKVTEFFRDRQLFDELRDAVIPELIDEGRKRGNELRVWSAACATGEEAYSLAILIADALGADAALFNVRIFATDIDEAAISFARRGVYPRDSIADLDPALVARHFTPVDGGYEVGKTIRNMTVFGQHDLGQRAPFPRIDLALCRNVLIYFSKELQTRTLQIFAFSLRNGGYLALGKAETTNPLSEYFEVVDAQLRIFRRYGERVLIPPVQMQKTLYPGREIERIARRVPDAVTQPIAIDSRQSLHERIGAALLSSTVGIVVVDRHYDIVALNAAARSMLNIHGVAIGEDLVHSLPAKSAPVLRGWLDAALRSEEPTPGGREIEVSETNEFERRFLTVASYPARDDNGDVTGAVLLIVDVTAIVEERRTFQTRSEQQTIELATLGRSEQNARERLRSLLEANKQLAGANADLRALNDALVIGAEEAEAATEEIETLNEEMQATNEELETLNEEFQATIEELNTTNDELEARSIDLQRLADLREQQRIDAERSTAALAAIVDELPNAIAAVDRDGTIITANRRFRELQAAASDSSVEIIDDAGARIPLGVVVRRAAEGESFTFDYRIIAADQSRRDHRGQVTAAAPPSPAAAIITLVPA